MASISTNSISFLSKSTLHAHPSPLLPIALQRQLKNHRLMSEEMYSFLNDTHLPSPFGTFDRAVTIGVSFPITRVQSCRGRKVRDGEKGSNQSAHSIRLPPHEAMLESFLPILTGTTARLFVLWGGCALHFEFRIPLS